MPDVTRECCAGCRFWIPLEERAGWGECRRRAPVLLPEESDGFWALTPKSCWCGEFEAQPHG